LFFDIEGSNAGIATEHLGRHRRIVYEVAIFSKGLEPRLLSEEERWTNCLEQWIAGVPKGQTVTENDALVAVRQEFPGPPRPSRDFVRDWKKRHRRRFATRGQRK
jgi:hypothetical protein